MFLCWLEEMLCPKKEIVGGKKIVQGVQGDLMSRIAAMCYLSETFPFFPHWRGEFCRMTTPKLAGNVLTYHVYWETSQYLSQVAGCRCTLLSENSSVWSGWQWGTDKFFRAMLPKCLKWLQEAGSAFFGKDIKFMLVMTNYAKICASTICQSLIWCL